MQVFERYHYLVLPKMENITGENSTVITCGIAISGVHVLETMQLQAHYKLSNSLYSSILNNYNKASVRVRNARSK